MLIPTSQHTHSHTHWCNLWATKYLHRLRVGCWLLCGRGSTLPPTLGWPNVCLRLPFLTLDYFKCFCCLLRIWLCLSIFAFGLTRTHTHTLALALLALALHIKFAWLASAYFSWHFVCPATPLDLCNEYLVTQIYRHHPHHPPIASSPVHHSIYQLAADSWPRTQLIEILLKLLSKWLIYQVAFAAVQSIDNLANNPIMRLQRDLSHADNNNGTHTRTERESVVSRVASHAD